MDTPALKKILAEHLWRFAQTIREIDLDDDRVFHEMLQFAFRYCDVDRGEMCRELKVSRGTLSKWSTAKIAPHMMVRPVIAQWIGQRVTSKVVELQNE